MTVPSDTFGPLAPALAAFFEILGGFPRSACRRPCIAGQGAAGHPSERIGRRWRGILDGGRALPRRVRDRPEASRAALTPLH
jgi:hypothetical protein